jgi:hypothetical protein
VGSGSRGIVSDRHDGLRQQQLALRGGQQRRALKGSRRPALRAAKSRLQAHQKGPLQRGEVVGRLEGDIERALWRPVAVHQWHHHEGGHQLVGLREHVARWVGAALHVAGAVADEARLLGGGAVGGGSGLRKCTLSSITLLWDRTAVLIQRPPVPPVFTPSCRPERWPAACCQGTSQTPQAGALRGGRRRPGCPGLMARESRMKAHSKKGPARPAQQGGVRHITRSKTGRLTGNGGSVSGTGPAESLRWVPEPGCGRLVGRNAHRASLGP